MIARTTQTEQIDPSGRQAGYGARILAGITSLLQGMGLTFSYFIDPRKVVTQQYPENRETLVMVPRLRGALEMVHDESGHHHCTACGLCEKACPNGSISVLTTKNQAGRKMLGRYLYRFSQCTLCNLCVEACPFEAIQMGQGFEWATNSRAALTLTLNPQKSLG